MLWRYRLSLGLEALVWALAMGWLIFLVADVAQTFRATGVFAWRSVLELVLLALLVYWPMVRTRIVHGYWMRDWDDAPEKPPTVLVPPTHHRQHPRRPKH